MGKKLKRLAKIAKWAVSPIILYAATLPITYISNKYAKTQPNTAVFSTSASNSGIATLTDFFMYPVVTFGQNRKGNRVDWYTCPTEKEFLENIVKEKYSNIILIGHGTYQCYSAKDCEVVSWQIERKMQEKGAPKKDGFLVQYTCSYERGPVPTIREVMMKDPNKGYSLEGKIGPLDIYFTAIKELFSPRK